MIINWLTENLSTIVISLILLAVVIFITVRLIKDKRSGKSSCGCGCDSCALRGECHKK